MKLIIVLLLFFSNEIDGSGDPDCYTRWMSGYRLASGRPQKIINGVTLKTCEQHCMTNFGCAAFAYGTSPESNGTCELAVTSLRTSRSLNNLTLTDLDKALSYDVYIESTFSDKQKCFKRSHLFANNNNNLPIDSSNKGVPIDCFYRLMSGKRLSKTHALKSVSVNSLQECEEACISERSFACRSVSYRYMPSGYSYSVSNCELSPFYLMSQQATTMDNSKYDFIDDFDYDYFQREPFCKTTNNNENNFGVCAVVVRRGGRITSSLVKSSHQVSTSSQCEHLCTTSLFRCRAFAFRHTERGRVDPFHRGIIQQPTSINSCQLYESDLSRLPSYNIEPDTDFDLFEMGRLMGGQCLLQQQFNNKRPNTIIHSFDKYPPVTNPPNSIRYHDHAQDRVDRYPNPSAYPSAYPNPSAYPSAYPNPSAYPSAYPSYYPPHQHNTISHHQQGNDQFPRPPLPTISSKPQDIVEHHDNPLRPHPPELIMSQEGHNLYQNNTNNLPFYDKEREACLVVHRVDSTLTPSASRATFPVKTVEECRVECLRSEQVLRFPCRVMAFRSTSSTGGSCQLSDTEARDLRETDYVVARDRYENAITYFYDQHSDRNCFRDNNNNNNNIRRYDQFDNNRRDFHYGSSHYPQNYPQNYPQGSNYPPPPSSNYPPAPQSIVSKYPNYQYAPNQPSNGGYNKGYETQQRYYYPATTTTSDRYYDHHHYPSTTGAHYGGSSTGGQYGNNYGTGGGQYGHNYGTGGGQYGHNYGTGYGQQSNYGTTVSSEYYGGAGMRTVDGERCMHSCVRNKDAGFYYCQIDQEGSWNFCCRPDEGGECGYSRGLSFSWCYVGTGPSRNIWRTCNRASSSPKLPQVSYLHDRQPPTVVTLSDVGQIANLTRDDALKLINKEDNNNKDNNINKTEIVNTPNKDVVVVVNKT